MATNQNIKDALSFPGDTLDTEGLTRFQSALTAEIGTAADANDAARWLRKSANGFTKYRERQVQEDALTSISDL